MMKVDIITTFYAIIGKFNSYQKQDVSCLISWAKNKETKSESAQLKKSSIPSVKSQKWKIVCPILIALLQRNEWSSTQFDFYVP